MGLSQSEAAIRVGIDPSTLGRIERNEVAPSRKVAAKLRKKLKLLDDPITKGTPHVHDPTAAPGPAG